MNSVILEKLMYLMVGGAAGSLITGFVMKSKNDEKINLLEDELDKYESHFDEEIAKTRAAIIEEWRSDETNNKRYDNKSDEDTDEDVEKLEKISSNIVNQVKKAKEKPDMKNIIEKNGYRNEPEFNDEEEDDEFDEENLDDEDDSPFLEEDTDIITAEEFGEYRDYEKEFLFYLRDKTLVDEQGIIIDEVTDIVGDALNQFNEYDDNHVYVRNYRLKSDFDIFRDTEHTSKNFREG